MASATPSEILTAVRKKMATGGRVKPKETRTRGQSVMAALHGGKGPHVSEGWSGRDSGVLPIQKAFGVAAGMLDASDPEVREALDLSARIKQVYGPFYAFSNHPRAILVPASDPANRVTGGFLPTHTPEGFDIPGAAGVCKEIGQRVATVKGIDPDELRAKADSGNFLATKVLSTISDIAGGSLVAPPSLGDLIDLQRNLEVFSRAGATNVTLPPNGRLDFPKLANGATAFWVGETQSVTPSEQKTGTLKLEVRKLAVRVPLTNELMRFSDTSVDSMIRVDMARIAAQRADLAMLEGTGGTQIKGLITYESQSAWSQGSDKLLAHSVTASKVQPEDLNLMAAGLPDGVDPSALVIHPKLWAVLVNRRAGSGFADNDGKGLFLTGVTRNLSDNSLRKLIMGDMPVLTSRQVSITRGSGAQTYVILGHFPDWLVGRLGVIEFMADPYTQMQNYITNVQAIEFVDAGARHAASFAFADAIDQS